MKIAKPNSERRVAFILSLTILVDHWYVASGVAKPLGSLELGSRHTVLPPARPAVEPQASKASKAQQGQQDRPRRPQVSRVRKLRAASQASKLRGVSKAHQPKRADKVESSGSMSTSLIQRKASRFLRRAPVGMQNVEDNVEIIWGVPKIVWVILANVLAMAAWMGCIAAGLYMSRQPAMRPENEEWEAVSARNAAYVQDYPEQYRYSEQPYPQPHMASSGLLAYPPDYQKYSAGNSAFNLPQTTSTGQPTPTFNGGGQPSPTFFGGDAQFQDMRRQLRV